ncbi:DUF6538 domain-containing protein [Cypionkella sp.]|uniref:DUF6538 domain-containing protein n=1 Tax=Cypionkella sp. TaxID=2811411 RepID=UPI003751374E
MQTKLQTKKLHHTFIRDGRFYFSRRVPIDLQDHYTVPRIVRALGTSSPVEARKLATIASAQLESYWANMRLTRIEAIGHDLRVMSGAIAPNAMIALQGTAMPALVAAITISEARDLYIQQKGKGRPPTFKRAADRSTAYLVAA